MALDPKRLKLRKDGSPVDGFRVMGRVAELAVAASLRTGLEGLRTSDLPGSIPLKLDGKSGERLVQVHNEDRQLAVQVFDFGPHSHSMPSARTDDGSSSCSTPARFPSGIHSHARARTAHVPTEDIGTHCTQRTRNDIHKCINDTNVKHRRHRARVGACTHGASLYACRRHCTHRQRHAFTTCTDVHRTGFRV